MPGSIDAINEAFHEAYAAARERHAGDAPVIVLLADELIVHHAGARRVHVVRSRAFHAIKSVSHAPVALYALGPDAPEAALAALEQHVEAGCARTADLDGTDARADCEETLRLTALAIAGVRARTIDLRAFAASVGPLLRRLTRAATAVHLAALDSAVDAELARMTAAERAELQVVVTGDHQARSRSLGMQYFAKRLPSGAPAGERVLYAEGIADEEAAVQLVALQRLDREVAAAFFGDPARLQSDVLGDAAEELLGLGHFAPIR